MSDTNSPEFWNENYDNGHIPWDLGGPTPVFRRLLHSGEYRPGKMMVLGAGRGHDARLFARHGFTVRAVDFAPQAVQAMRAHQDSDTAMTILQSDIFDLPYELTETFDYVLEYTCYCAIDPDRRQEYADVVSQLLKVKGRYIALAFPIGDRTGGPPFAVSPDQMVSLFRARGFALRHREFPPESVSPRQGREELLILQKLLADQ